MDTEQFDLSGGAFSNNVVETPKATKKKAGKKTAKRAAKPKAEPSKRTRRTRVAAIATDAAQVLTAVADMSKKDLAAFQAILAALNPLPRPARKRVIAAVITVIGGMA